MMQNSLLMERLHFVMGLAPVADGFNGTVTSDIVTLKNFDRCLWLVVVGVGSTGTATLTCEACDDVSASNVSAVPFKYRVVTSGDTEGAITTAAAAGFLTTAGSAQFYMVEIETEALIASGYSYCRLKAVEVTNDPILVGIVGIMGDARYERPIKETAIV